MFAASVEFFIFITLSLCWFTESNLYEKGDVTGKFEHETKFQTFTLIESESISLNGDNMELLTTEDHSHAARFFDFQLVGKIVVPIITIIGILGNSMSIIIINQKYFRKQSISLILTCLAISDSMVLLLLLSPNGSTTHSPMIPFEFSLNEFLRIYRIRRNYFCNNGIFEPPTFCI